MSSRDTILKSIRKNEMPEIPLPELDASEWIQYDDLIGQFSEVLAAVGGEAVVVSDLEAANEHLKSIEQFADAQKIVSLVDGVGSPNVDMNEVLEPHELADVDFAILLGKFGVAENGAIWLDLREAKHRVICVLSQYLAIVLSKDDIVPHMHAAYDRLTDAPEIENAPADFRSAGFGVFMSGPSKTADIEQSLVIGAHGAKGLTVYLV
ncbi:LutC/YkgG family protein [Calycomorphotria hydatis]|uniref:Lactate utilization protein C n=1 Tax=Calycomorphotria hydatis TaxID=2528027 RepID=A0A517T6K3_9PLAN|nr:LUD domain-containing protein [Calycomorphotria hydatis]QDT64004.1 Lactate utilization protein C [Calycomorphotria hydatis]